MRWSETSTYMLEGQMAEQSKGFAQKDTFGAYVEHLPPHPETVVVVSGKVEYRSGGLTASLVKASPQGINPEILILEVHDTKTGSTSTDPVITQFVEYTGANTAGFKQVTVRSAAPDFTIDIDQR
jgi:hypothetical protein